MAADFRFGGCLSLAGVPALPPGAHYNENNKLMLTDVQGSSSRFRRVFAAGLAAALSLCAPQLPAATIIVTGLADQNNYADGCSLREAIINAETDSKLGSVECARGVGADLIILPPHAVDVIGVNTSLVEESDPATGDLDITSDITVLGGGQQFSILSAGHGGRLFDVHPGGKLTLRGVMLMHGRADDSDGSGQPFGGAIRVGGASGVLVSELVADDIGILSSSTYALLATDGGAAIYAGPGSQVTVSRGQFLFNEAQGTSGTGGGIYCDGCNLGVDASTFAKNVASLAAGVYIGPGSTASLEFVSVGFNSAPNAAGVYNDGALQFYASVAGDNAGGMSGDDVTCAGGSFTAQYSLIEYPQGCALAGVQTRADLAVGTEQYIFRELNQQRFDYQPSRVLPPNIGFPRVPVAQCAGRVDQLGTPVVNTPIAPYTLPASSDGDCVSGAYELPLAAIDPMAASAVAGGAMVRLNVGILAMLGTDAVMHIQPRDTGIPGENCDFIGVDIPIPATTGGSSVSIDPDALFVSPELDRRYRVCELEGVIISPEAAFNGATTGVIRILFDDGLAALGGGLSSPAPGRYLQFGTVPVGAGGDAAITFFPGTEPLSINSVVISGADASYFALNTTLPLVVPAGPAPGVPLSFHCNGGEFGSYDAIAEVSAVRTVSMQPLQLVYGLRCRVAHLLSVEASPYLGRIGEADGVDLRITGRLDSPNVTSGPVLFDVYYDGGTATPGSDFDPFVPSSVVPLTLSIPVGETEAHVDIGVNNDLEFSEGEETLLAHIEIPLADEVSLVGSGSVGLRIADDDVPVIGAAVTLNGMPSLVRPASEVTVTIVAENTSSVAPLNNAHVQSTVDAPARVLSYLVTEIQVTCQAYKAYLQAKFKDDPVALAAVLAAVTCVDGDMLSSLPQDTDNDSILEPANELALKLLAHSSCTIPGSMAYGDCGFAYAIPSGTKIEVRAVVQMATMATAPQLNFPGQMVAYLTGSGEGGLVTAQDASPYVIDGDEKAKEGGLGWPFLLIAGLLVLRGRRMRSTGRKIG